jgi:hypothetical protein
LLEYHQLDTPTSVLFPWMHGIGGGVSIRRKGNQRFAICAGAYPFYPKNCSRGPSAPRGWICTCTDGESLIAFSSDRNPPLNPPRYRGLSLLKAPRLAKTTYDDVAESNESTNRHGRHSSVSTPDQPSAGSVTQPIAVHTSEGHHAIRDRAASISTFLSSMSASTWASTDTSDPSLYSFGSTVHPSLVSTEVVLPLPDGWYAWSQ